MENKEQIKEDNQSQVFKDYTEKIRGKLNIIPNTSLKPEEFNSLIMLLNYCFMKQNNFFIESFNKRNIKVICNTYNQIKTNVLNREERDILNVCDCTSLKMIKFILIQFLSKYDKIKLTDDILCQKVSKASIKACHQYLTSYISNYQKMMD